MLVFRGERCGLDTLLLDATTMMVEAVWVVP